MVLQSIRDRLNGIIAIFVLAILIVPFAFVGVSSYFTSDAVNSVAVVNEQEISISDFNQSFQNYRRRMQSVLGAQFDPELFDQPIIRRQHLDTMIDEELLSQASFEAGLSVANDRLARAIRDIPAFQVDGEFSDEVYKSRLTGQGMTVQQFESNMRIDMVMNQFPSVLASSAISTEWEVKNYVRLQDQKRAFSAILIPAGAPQDEPESDSAVESADDAAASEESPESASEALPEEIDEEAIVAWYEAHAGDFNSEEMVVVEYLELDAATMGGEIAVDDELLKARFEEQKLRFITPEARLASHILISVDSTAPEAEVETARQQAEALAARAMDGEDFAELASEHSQDSGSAADGGDLGWVEPGFMVQSFEDGLYGLTIDRPISEPIQSGFGWHVINLRDIRPAEGMTFSEAREILLAEYQAEADERRFLEQADRMVDLIYEDPTTLATAAEDLGLEILEVGPFTRAGGEGIAANPEVIKASFSDLVLLQSSVSDPVDLDENHLVMIRLKEHLPQALRPLDEVRDEVIAAVRHERAMQGAESTATALLAEISTGADMSALAQERGLELQTAEAATRISPDIQADLREHLFLMAVPAEGEPVLEIVKLADGFAVVRLESVVDGELTEEEALRTENYRRRISNASASSEIYAFLRMLRSQSEIEVFEDRL